MDEQQLIEVNPEVLLADDNIRYGLKKFRIESLAADIEDKGGIMVPIEVTALSAPANGKLYKVTAGHYRVAAAEMLIAEGKELKIPALVMPDMDPVTRLKRQLAENMERENQSPMDQAMAIRKLLDLGVSRPEIRDMFAIPGGRKGLALQPASNSFLNMRLSFLEFPRNIQEKIHDGRLPITSAYELAKKPRERWQEILEKAEQDRQAEIDREERAEGRYLADEAKREEAARKEQDRQAEVEAARALAAEASRAADLAVEQANQARAAAKQAGDMDARKQADEKFEELRVAADKAVKEAKAAKEKADQTAAKAKLKAAARARESKGKGPTQTNIRKAARKSGVDENGRVKLNAQEMRDVAHDLSLPSAFPKVQKIGAALVDCFDSLITTAQLLGRLGEITGEKKPKAAAR